MAWRPCAWAYPIIGGTYGTPIFAGAASYGSARLDVAAFFGAVFANTGYSLSVSGLPPGTYDLVVYARSTVTGTFNQYRVVRITVQ